MTEPIAIIGLGTVAPGVNSPAELWTALNEPPRFLGEPTRFAIDGVYSDDPREPDRTSGRGGGFIREFRPHPVVAGEIERGRWRDACAETLWLRHVLCEAMESVTVDAETRVGCYVGACTGGAGVEDTLLVTETARELAARLAESADERRRHERRLRQALRRRFPHAMSRPRQGLADLVVRRAIGGLLPAKTEWITLSAACASALYAVDLGVQALRSHERDLAFCGAVNGLNRLFVVAADKFGGGSRSGAPRAFDAHADGTVFSEAASMVAIKRLADAYQDGDRVLAVIAGSGTAVDGRGKGFAAPNPAGQRRAIERAWADGGDTSKTNAEWIDWILAHGTATIAGDQVELEALTGLLAGATPVCTSNKPVLGHGGWAAGGASIVQAVLALENESIPAEQAFSTPHPALATSTLRVPEDSVPWRPTSGRARTAGVSAFGLGGSNAHLVVSDPPIPTNGDPTYNQRIAPDRKVRARNGSERMALVAWSAVLPGDPDPDRIRRWLASGQDAPPRSFGDQFPLPSFDVTRLPPAVLAAADRTHLLALRAAHQFVAEHTELWSTLRETTGVITAQMGTSRYTTEATLRIGASDLLAVEVNESEAEAMADFLSTTGQKQGVTEETFAGYPPELAGFRIAHRWDLHGPTMTINTGLSSAHSALRIAGRYLADRRLDLALVLGVNGNASEAAVTFCEFERTEIAEGAFLLALARESFAVERGWPILAALETEAATTDAADHPSSPTFLAADGLVEVLRTATSGGRKRLVSAGPSVTVDAPVATSPLTRWECVLRPVPPRESPVGALPLAGVLLTSSAVLAPDLPHGTTVIAVGEEIGDIRDLAPEIVVLADGGPRSRELLEMLRECCQRFGERLSSVRIVVHDPLSDGRWQPLTGLFVGFARSLARELPDARVVTVVTDEDPSAGLASLSAEDVGVVYYRDGCRHVEHLRPATLPPGDLIGVLGERPVVVAVGGARGVTAVALEALARHCEPTIWLLGRTNLGGVPPEIQYAEDQEQGALRRDFVTEFRRTAPGTPVREINARFNRLWKAREVERTLERLRSVGSDVRYLSCDVTDVTAVARAAAMIGPTVDLLVHAANHQHAAPVITKSAADFRVVLDSKIAAYHHLKAAFPPKRWCTFGSALALLGMPGESDYTAANAYLAAAASTAENEVTIGWGLWEDTGVVSGPLERAGLRAGGIHRGMTDEEGAAAFLSEISQPRITNSAPYYLGDEQAANHHEPTRTRLLGAPDRRDADSAEWTWIVSAERDGYLLDHRIDDRPILPGMCMIAMAVEASAFLVPEMVVGGLRNIRFQEFVRADPTQPGPTKYRVVAKSDQRSVSVRILSDVITQSGTLLRRDREHASMTVLIGPRQEPRSWTPPPIDNPTPHPDPYCGHNTRFQFSGAFDHTPVIVAGRDTARARWKPSTTTAIANAAVPVALLDALGRARSFLPVADGEFALRAPRSLANLDLFTHLGDAPIADQYPEGVDLYYEADTDTCTAATSGGTVLAVMSGIDAPTFETVRLS